MKKRILPVLAAALLLSCLSLTALAAEDPPAAGSVSSSLTYSVTPSSSGGGSVLVSPADAQEGQTVSVTVTPKENRIIQSVTVTGEDGRDIPIVSLGNSEYSFIMPACSVTVLATLVSTETEAPTYRVNTVIMGNGSIHANPSSAAEGQTVAVSAVPDSGYAVKDFRVTDQTGKAIDSEVLDGTQYSFVMPGGPVTVSVEFVSQSAQAPTYTVTPIVTGSGRASVLPSAAASGQTVTVAVSPDPGYSVRSLTVIDQNGKAVTTTPLGNNQYRFVMPDSPVTVSADLGGQETSAPTYAVNPVVTGNGTLSVNPSPAAARQTVIVTVSPGPGYTVHSLTVTDKDGKAVTSAPLGGNQYSFVMPDSAVTVTAALVNPAETALTYPVSVSTSGNGKAFVSPATASAGQNIIVTATPDTSELITTVTATDKNGKAIAVETLNGGQYSFVMPDSEVSVTASFAKPETPPYSIRLVTEGRGQSILSATSAMPGQTINVRTLALSGSTVKSVVAVDKAGQRLVVRDLGNSQYNFAMPNSPVTVTVTYASAGTGTGTDTETDTKDSCRKDLSCPIAAFTDANPTAWYHDGVHFCLEQGLMNGVSSNRFDPTGTTTRAMIVTILWRQAGQPACSSAMTFSDVPGGKWYTEAIRWAQANKVVTGYNPSKFGPNDSITREQLATILFRYAESQGMKGSFAYLPFSDTASIHDWAFEGVCWCYSGKIVNGRVGNLFAPRDLATRAEAATMIQRFCEIGT